MVAAVPFSGKEDWKQVQCGDTEAAFYEQGQQAASISLPLESLHGGKGASLSLSQRPYVDYNSLLMVVCFSASLGGRNRKD